MCIKKAVRCSLLPPKKEFHLFNYSVHDDKGCFMLIGMINSWYQIQTSITQTFFSFYEHLHVNAWYMFIVLSATVIERVLLHH